MRSFDILALKEYNYYYENSALIRSVEFDITLDNNEFVTSKTQTLSTVYSYDSEGTLERKIITSADGLNQTFFYEKGENGDTVLKADSYMSHSKTDSFGRKVFEEIQGGATALSREFSYHEGEITEKHVWEHKTKSSPTTQLVREIAYSDGRTIEYEYDNEERITKVIDSVDGTTEYTYDALGQLLTETVNGTTTKFEYDNYGNIRAKGAVDETGEIAETTKIVYAYGNNEWKDLLTSYNGQSIVYDVQGNPVSYLGHTLTWEKGRQLKSYIKDDKNISFEYNANGIRTSKIVNGIEHKFTVDGAKILQIYCDQNYILEPIYDNEDSVCGLYYNSEPFYFQKNLQGDIIAISDYWGDIVARYTYDAWGKVTSITGGRTDIANANPFRYRGYFYDTETSLYYLQSRYYDANTGRFINADDSGILMIDNSDNNYNLFTYCRNNPTTYSDTYGFISISAFKRKSWVAGFVLKYITNLTYTVTKSIFNTPKWLGVYLDVNVGFSTQANPKSIIGFGYSKDSFDVGITAFSGKVGAAISIGVSWTETYIQASFLYSLDTEKKFCSINFKFAVMHWFTLGVAVLCYYLPPLIPVAKSAVKLFVSSPAMAKSILCTMIPAMVK